MLGKLLLTIILTLVSNFIYADSNILQSYILEFDSNVECINLATELKKMEQTLIEKKNIIKDSEKILRSAATHSTKYGNILLEYHRTLDQFKSMKKDYDWLVVAQEKYCISDHDKQSIN